MLEKVNLGLILISCWFVEARSSSTFCQYRMWLYHPVSMWLLQTSSLYIILKNQLNDRALQVKWKQSLALYTTVNFLLQLCQLLLSVLIRGLQWRSIVVLLHSAAFKQWALSLAPWNYRSVLVWLDTNAYSLHSSEADFKILMY